MSQGKQRNESAWYEKAMRPVTCPYKCKMPVPSTLFVRFHPFRQDVEIRECPECRKQAFFPTGEAFARWYPGPPKE